MNKSYKWMFISSIIVSVLSLVFATTVFFVRPKAPTTPNQPTQEQPSQTPSEPEPEPEPKLYEMSADGKYLYFGEYPQSLKADNVSIVTTRPDNQGYFLGDDGERYYLWNTRYFKVEPLKWRILTQEDGKAFVVCDVSVDYIEYADNDYYWGSEEAYYEAEVLDEGQRVAGNDYEYSNLRQYLNNDFYIRAFNGEERKIIPQTLVDNSPSQSSHKDNTYVTDDTLDYIFALSYEEVINEDYGFDSDYNAEDLMRRWQATDFSKKRGAWVWTPEDILRDYCGGNINDPNYQYYLGYVGNATAVALRTGYGYYPVENICCDGIIIDINWPDPPSRAEYRFDVVPAMWIEL